MFYFAIFVSRVLQMYLEDFLKMFLIIIKPFSRNFAKTPGSWVVSPLLTLFLRWHQRPTEPGNQRTRELEIFLNLENLQLYRVNFASSSYTNTKLYFYRY